MFSKSEFLVENDEAENVAKSYGNGGLIQLRSGDYISTSGIESISDPDLVPHWDGYLLEKSGNSFMRDGQRIFLETKDYKEIEYKLHPRYEQMKELLLSKTKMLSDKSRSEISEEVSREERDSILVIE